MERPSCPWTCLKTAPLSYLSAPRCLHTQTHLQRKLACDACSHAANEEARTALCCECAHAYVTCQKRVKHVFSSSKADFGLWKSILGRLQSPLTQLIIDFFSGLNVSAPSAVNGSKMEFNAYAAIQKKRENQMSLNPAGFAPNSAEDNNLHTDKTALRVRFFGSNAGEITSESGKQDSISPADHR